MSPSGLHVNKSALILLLALIGGAVVWYKFFSSSSPSSEKLEMKASGSETKTVDKTTVELKTVKVQDIDVSYREVSSESPKFDVLFLHGQAFNSETWATEPVLTLQLMKTLGYKGVAIDLPGKGKTGTPKDQDTFIADVIKELKLDKPVIVSPSASGHYSLPFLFKDPSTVLDRARGFVPVAPVETSTLKDNYKDAKIPTLIIYGSEDTGLGKESLENLKSLPKSTIEELPGAKHACYLDKPIEFNNKLEMFLKTLV